VGYEGENGKIAERDEVFEKSESPGVRQKR
jgi:hypothetical protein